MNHDRCCLEVEGVPYCVDNLRDTAGKRYALTSIAENKKPPYLSMCTRFTSCYGVECNDENEFNCPYIHLGSNKPIKADAQDALQSAKATKKITNTKSNINANTPNITKLYYHQQRLHIVPSDPELESRERLKNTFHDLYEKERKVLLAPYTNDATNLASDVVAEDAAGGITTLSAAADESSSPPAFNEIIVAIDPVGTKLRDDAISCKIIPPTASYSKRVLAVTSYTPNFVDTAIALGKLHADTSTGSKKPSPLQLAYGLYKPHYIHTPEKIWGPWGESISLSATKTVSAIAATRHYDIEMENQPQGGFTIKVLGICHPDSQPPTPICIKNVCLTHCIDYETANQHISATVPTEPSIVHTLSLAGAVAKWHASSQQSDGTTAPKAPLNPNAVTAEPSAAHSFHNKKFPSVFVAYRGYGDLEQDSLAHGVVGVASQQMKELCYTIVDKARAFQSSRRQYPNTAQLTKLCEIAGIETTDQYQDVYAALSAKGFNVLAVERSIGCDITDHLTLLSDYKPMPQRRDNSSLECTKPLRSFLSCYHQFLVLNAIDPKSGAEKLRVKLLKSLPSTTTVLDDFNRKGRSLAWTMFERTHQISRHLAEVAPHIQLPMEAIVVEVPSEVIIKVFIPQLTAPPKDGGKPKLLVPMTINVSKGTIFKVGSAVTLMISVGRIANPRDPEAGKCFVVSNNTIPRGLVPPCFEGGAALVVANENVTTTIGAPATSVPTTTTTTTTTIPDPLEFFQKYIANNKNASSSSSSSSAPTPSYSGRDMPLPIDRHMKGILSRIRANRVTCLKGDTGCGKSTMVPLNIYLDAKKNNEKVTIIVTQPKRLATTMLASRIAKLLKEDVGKTVGYRMGKKSSNYSSDTRIFLVTSGYISRHFAQNGDLWKKATHIVLDEVHERSLEADMMSLVLKLKLERDDTATPPGGPRTSKRLIVMSATINSKLFIDYFAPLCWNGCPMQPLIQVGGRREPVAELLLPDIIRALSSSPNTPPAVAASIMSLQAYLGKLPHLTEQTRPPPRPPRIETIDISTICDLIVVCVKKATCILVFLPTIKNIEDVAKALSTRQSYKDMNVLELHSKIESDLQDEVAKIAVKDCKVVLSTNIAETSVTIPDVKIVIDLGLLVRARHDQEYDAMRHDVGWCSRAAARQRAGRAGRVTSGIVLRLYTKSIMSYAMHAFEKSELNSLEPSILQMRDTLQDFGSVQELMQKLVQPPSTGKVTNALERLAKMGALGLAPDYELLPLGKLAASLPIGVRLTKAILSAARFGCATDMVVIACGLQQGGYVNIHPQRGKAHNDDEYESNVEYAWKSIRHFDRTKKSDLHYFLAVVEELHNYNSKALPPDVYDFFNKNRNFANQHYLNLQVLKNLIRDINSLCNDLLSKESAQSILTLTDEDKKRMKILESMEEFSSNQSSSLKFPSLDQGSIVDELFQLTLSHAANGIFAKAISTASAFGSNHNFQQHASNVSHDNWSPIGMEGCLFPSQWSVLKEVQASDRQVIGCGFGLSRQHPKFFSERSFLLLESLSPIARLSVHNLINLGREKPIDICVLPSRCCFSLAAGKGLQNLTDVPLPALLMANLHQILIGPLCTTSKMCKALQDAYTSLREIVRSMSTKSKVSADNYTFNDDGAFNPMAYYITMKTRRISGDDQTMPITTVSGGSAGEPEGMSDRMFSVMSATPVNILSQRLFRINHVHRKLRGSSVELDPDWTKSVTIYNTAMEGHELEDKLRIEVSSISTESSDDDDEEAYIQEDESDSDFEESELDSEESSSDFEESELDSEESSSDFEESELDSEDEREMQAAEKTRQKRKDVEENKHALLLHKNYLNNIRKSKEEERIKAKKRADKKAAKKKELEEKAEKKEERARNNCANMLAPDNRCLKKCDLGNQYCGECIIIRSSAIAKIVKNICSTKKCPRNAVPGTQYCRGCTVLAPITCPRKLKNGSPCPNPVEGDTGVCIDHAKKEPTLCSGIDNGIPCPRLPQGDTGLCSDHAAAGRNKCMHLPNGVVCDQYAMPGRDCCTGCFILLATKPLKGSTSSKRCEGDNGNCPLFIKKGKYCPKHKLHKPSEPEKNDDNDTS